MYDDNWVGLSWIICMIYRHLTFAAEASWILGFTSLFSNIFLGYFEIGNLDIMWFIFISQLAGTAKSRFSAKDYSDHMALVRAYEGWKDADREGSGYEYCWRNFLSSQTLQAIHSLRKQFSFILKDAGLLEADASTWNSLSHNQSLVRTILCSGLFPGISSVVVNHPEHSLHLIHE